MSLHQEGKAKFIGRTWLLCVLALVGLNIAQSALAADYWISEAQISQPGITGAWYDPAQSGQGLMVNVIPPGSPGGEASYFVGWFTYATDTMFPPNPAIVNGAPFWLTAQGSAADVSVAPGANEYGKGLGVYATNGALGRFDAGPKVSSAGVGVAYVAMQDCNHMLFDARDNINHFIGPEEISIHLVRLMPNINCSDSVPPAAPQRSTAGLSGAWYDPATSGQGFTFEVNPLANGGYFFGGWFTYAAPPARAGQRWYTLQGPMSFADDTASVGIFETTGGTFVRPNTPATVITTKQVGTATVAFLSCTNATLHYVFSAGENAGHTNDIHLQRLGAAPGYCTL